MTLNRDYFEGKWQQTRGLARQRWAELTDDDLNKLHGRYEQFIGLLQEKYGLNRAKAESEIQDWLSDVEAGTVAAVSRLDQKVRNNRWKALTTTLLAGFAFGLWVGLKMEASS